MHLIFRGTAPTIHADDPTLHLATCATLHLGDSRVSSACSWHGFYAVINNVNGKCKCEMRKCVTKCKRSRQLEGFYAVHVMPGKCRMTRFLVVHLAIAAPASVPTRSAQCIWQHCATVRGTLASIAQASASPSECDHHNVFIFVTLLPLRRLQSGTECRMQPKKSQL